MTKRDQKHIRVVYFLSEETDRGRTHSSHPGLSARSRPRALDPMKVRWRSRGWRGLREVKGGGLRGRGTRFLKVEAASF